MKFIAFTVSLIFLLGAFTSTQAEETLKSAYLKAAKASSGDRGSFNAILRHAVDNITDKNLAGEELFYAGTMAARIRRFDDAAGWLEKYLAGPGENKPVALATLIDVYYWKKDYQAGAGFYSLFNKNYGDSTIVDPLHNGKPIKILAEIGYARSMLGLGERDKWTGALKRAIDMIGDNSQGHVSDMELVNYHSWYATSLKTKHGWEKAVEHLEANALPIFKEKPAYNAKIRDRAQFIRLEHYVATEQYAKGLAELQATVDSYKVDDISYRRVKKALGRFSLYKQPAPELEYQAWIHGEPTKLAQLRGKVVVLYFFWSG